MLAPYLLSFQQWHIISVAAGAYRPLSSPNLSRLWPHQGQDVQRGFDPLNQPAAFLKILQRPLLLLNAVVTWDVLHYWKSHWQCMFWWKMHDLKKSVTVEGWWGLPIYHSDVLLLTLVLHAQAPNAKLQIPTATKNPGTKTILCIKKILC